MSELIFKGLSDKILEQLANGAFLTVKDNEGNLNTMTIAWGSLGYMWRKPVFTAMVRYSRHTFNLIETADDFTVSFPLKGQLQKELELCGTTSGRDGDKFTLNNIDLKESNEVKSPVIAGCDLHLECKIIHKQPLDARFMSEEILDIYGDEKDYHVLYYGEILAYRTHD